MTGPNFSKRVIKANFLIVCLILSVNSLHLRVLHAQSSAVSSLFVAINAIETNIKNLQSNAEENSQMLMKTSDI